HENNDNNKPLPVLRTVMDYESYIPKRHKKDYDIRALPPSLKEAIRLFIISCAARAARGQVLKHKSMLVHVTRFVNVQRQVRDLVEEELLNYQRSLEFEGKSFGKTTLYDDLEQLWFRDFVPATCEIMKRIPDTLITTLRWDTVKKHLYIEAAKIQVKTVNGEAREVLDYVEHVNGMSVIAVGGNKLSRGLTLEGLSVSYYLRASRMYDTLLQMGRWFGYKDGFLDFCKLYTTRELMYWYQHIASANEELRREFDYMSIRGANPEEYGLRVKSHPGGILKITSAYKMRNNLELNITFSGLLIETTRFSKSKSSNNDNLKNIDIWIKSLGNPTTNAKQQESSSYIWNNIDSGKIVDYLSTRYKTFDMFSGVDPEHTAQYIEEM
ncbi:Z1 domain-containing protein, partial [bacterium]|nr:Z1 domain-containing protein [bacterium]